MVRIRLPLSRIKPSSAFNLYCLLLCGSLFFILLSSALAFPLEILVGFSPQQLLHAGDQCPIDIPPTCTNSTPVKNSCCFESPEELSSNPIWDYYPPIGAADEFTLYGLWPDNCDGTYEQFLRRHFEHSNGRIHEIIVGSSRTHSCMREMQKVWKTSTVMTWSHFGSMNSISMLHVCKRWSPHATVHYSSRTKMSMIISVSPWKPIQEVAHFWVFSQNGMWNPL